MATSHWVVALSASQLHFRSELQTAFAVVVILIVAVAVIMWIRRRRWRKELGLTRPSREAWNGPNAPEYETIAYQRRDDSGQGGGG